MPSSKAIKNLVNFLFDRKTLELHNFSALFILFRDIVSGRKILVARVDRIGHLILDTVAFLRGVELEPQRKQEFVVFFPEYRSCNQYVRSAAIKVLEEIGVQVSQSRLIDILFAIALRFGLVANSGNDMLLGALEYSNNRFIHIIHNHNYAKRVPLTVFKKYLKNLTETSTPIPRHVIDTPKSIVALYARDDVYTQENLGLNSANDYHSYRNSSYDDLHGLENFLSRSGHLCVRMGDKIANHDSNLFSSSHVTLNEIAIDNDGSAEIVVLQKAKAYVGDTSGLAYLASALDIPVLRFNWIPVLNSLPNNSLVCPSLIRDSKSKNLVSYDAVYRELRANELPIWYSSSYEKIGVLVESVPTQIIKESVIELLDRIDNKNFSIQTSIQLDYELWLSQFNVFDPGLLSQSFVDAYGELLSG